MRYLLMKREQTCTKMGKHFNRYFMKRIFKWSINVFLKSTSASLGEC